MKLQSCRVVDMAIHDVTGWPYILSFVLVCGDGNGEKYFLGD